METEPTEAPPPTLVVCTACRARLPLTEGEAPPGKILHDAVASALAATPESRLRLRGVTCLAACDQGCTAVMMSPGKWSYLLGHLEPIQAADLIAYAATYDASTNGAVLRSRRPESLRHAVLGRAPSFPPQDPTA